MFRSGLRSLSRSRVTESVDHFYSRVLSTASIAQASAEAHKDVYRLEPFEKAYKIEVSRVSEISKPIKVEIPNFKDEAKRTLYSVASLTPSDVEAHFGMLKGTFTPAEAMQMLDELLAKIDRSRVTAQIALWGSKTFADAGHELEEVLALLTLIRETSQAADGSALGRSFHGSGKNALVLPATNFPLLALKDAVWLVLQGYRVVLGVQPRYFRMYEDIITDFMPSAKSNSIISLLPLLTRQNEAALKRSVELVAAFRFTGNSRLFKKLYAVGLRVSRKFDAGGEISGINRTVLDESLTVSSPMSPGANRVLVEGLHWSITANNGELCSSTSMVESSLDRGRLQELSNALYQHDLTPGLYGDYKAKLLVRNDKQQGLKLIHEPQEIREYWDKTAMFVPRGFGDTFNALTHCVYAATVEIALRRAVKSHASNLYVCAAPQEGSSLPRVGTTGAKIPESIFGSMRSYTNSVGGNHDGVGTAQWLLNLVRTKITGGRKSRLSESLPEEVEQLCDFLEDQGTRREFVSETIPEILDVFQFFADKPEIHGPYDGQPVVNGQGVSQVVSLKAIRSSIKQFILPVFFTNSTAALNNLVKFLAVERLSPWRANRLPTIHVIQDGNSKPLSETLKCFLRFLDKNSFATVCYHSDWTSLAKQVEVDVLPPYFHAIGDLNALSEVFVQTVASRGGFLYEGFPSDPLAIFKESTTSQAWACGIQKEELGFVRNLLKEIYKYECFKPHWHPISLHVEPTEEEEEETMTQEGGKAF